MEKFSSSIENRGGEIVSTPEAPGCLKSAFEGSETMMSLATCQFIETCTYRVRQGLFASVETGICAAERFSKVGETILNLPADRA